MLRGLPVSGADKDHPSAPKIGTGFACKSNKTLLDLLTKLTYERVTGTELFIIRGLTVLFLHPCVYKHCTYSFNYMIHSAILRLHKTSASLFCRAQESHACAIKHVCASSGETCNDARRCANSWNLHPSSTVA